MIKLRTTVWSHTDSTQILHETKTLVDRVSVNNGDIKRFKLSDGTFITGKLNWVQFGDGNNAWLDYILL